MTVTPKNQAVNIGDDVKLYCQESESAASSGQPVTFQWSRKSGNEITKVLTTTERSLEIQNIGKEDADVYICNGALLTPYDTLQASDEGQVNVFGKCVRCYLKSCGTSKKLIMLQVVKMMNLDAMMESAYNHLRDATLFETARKEKMSKIAVKILIFLMSCL